MKRALSAAMVGLMVGWMIGETPKSNWEYGPFRVISGKGVMAVNGNWDFCEIEDGWWACFDGPAPPPIPSPAPTDPPVEDDFGTAPSAIRVMADRAASLCGVDPTMFRRLIAKESGWRPLAIGPMGSVGLAQVQFATARELSPTLDIRTDWGNLVAGACILRGFYDRKTRGTDHERWEEALKDYNGGPNRKRTLESTVKYAKEINRR